MNNVMVWGTADSQTLCLRILATFFHKNQDREWKRHGFNCDWQVHLLIAGLMPMLEELCRRCFVGDGGWKVINHTD